jgi:Abnormal spindle-like microcephaly-assoc'd, ASPM-SPD-2-Hydin/Transmembrane protein 131-like N-terminal
VTGTPVIDLTSKTLYVVSHTLERNTYFMRLHALDITTGAEKFGGPVAITATVPGSGSGSIGGQVQLDVKNDLARPALLLANGVLYIAQGGNHGWILTYDPTTLTQIAAYASTPNGTLGGVWQSGAGLSADSSGNVYAASGDGTFDASTGGTDYGDSVVKLDSGLNVLDYFTPMDQACRFTSDMDLAAGGAMVLPTQLGSNPDELIISGKGGYPCDPSSQSPIYSLNRDSLGQYDPNQDHDIQTINGSPVGYWSSPAYWKGPNSTYIYFAGVTAEHSLGDKLKAYSLTNGLLSTAAVSQTTNSFVNGGTPSVSANGNEQGIVWLLSRQDFLYQRPGVMPAVLYAFDATNLSTMLYSSATSTQYGKRDQAGCGAKFQVPTIADGRVFVGTESELDIYGLLNQPLPAYPVILSSPCLTFGSVTVGSTGKAQTVTLTNNGRNNLTVNSISAGGLNAGDFTQTNTCVGKSLATGKTCNITINFAPSVTGPRTAAININEHVITPQAIYVIGDGAAAVTLIPSVMDFGTIKVGESSKAKIATFSNTGTANVGITSIAVTGIDSSDYAQSNNCPGTLEPSQNCTINVTFTPTAIGERAAQVTVYSSAGPPLQTVLSGKGK